MLGGAPALRIEGDRVRTGQRAVVAALRTRGAQITGSTAVVLNAVFIRIPDGGASDLLAIPGVKRIYPVRVYKTTLDHALPLHKVPDAWVLAGGAANAGAGVKIAMLDTGIDVNYPAFKDATLPMPPGFPKVNQDSDRPFTSNKVIVARSYEDRPGHDHTAADTNGHGTSTAMCAAGGTVDAPTGVLTGVAPRAWLGNYKVFPDGEDGASDDLIIQAIEDAVNDGMDILNLSLGSVPATRLSDDPLVQAIENAIAAGRIVTVSAANSGPDPGTVGSPGTATDAIAVGSIPNDRIFAGSLAAGGRRFAAVPGNGSDKASPVSALLVDTTKFDPTGLACSSLPAGSLQGSIAFIARGTCLFEAKLNNAQAAGAVAAVLYTDAAHPEAFPIAVGTATLPAALLGYVDGTAVKQAIASGPLRATLTFTPSAQAFATGFVSTFSSRGPNVDGGVKPDIVAVGDSLLVTVQGGSYGVASGTSFSAPLVAGAAAVLKAARPGLTADQYRSLLINTASPLAQPNGHIIDVQQMGAGALNLWQAVQGTATLNPVALSFGAGGGTVDEKQTLTITNIGNQTDTFAILALPFTPGPAPRVSQNTVRLTPGASRKITVEFSGTALIPGGYYGFISITGVRSGGGAKAPYWYGVRSATVQRISILDAPDTADPGATCDILFRVADGEGLPVSVTPVVTAPAGGGSVIAVESADAVYPGISHAQVTVGADPGDYTFHIAAGSISQDVTIAVN